MSDEFQSHYVYVIKCCDGTLYTGYARDVDQRVRAHNAGCGAKYTRGRRPVRLLYSEAFDSKSAALRREREIKGKTRKAKFNLIRANGQRDSSLQGREP